jgi:hypothetical protein
MIDKYLAIGLGALIALAPVAAVAQVQVAQATTDQGTSMAAPTQGHTGSHRGHRRRKSRTAGHRARASAHHMHKKRTAPAAPAEAPKS